jgi:hypothetical protein
MMLYTCNGLMEMLFQSGVLYLEFRGILDVIKILTIFSYSFCTCISVISLIRECIEH